MKVSNSKLQNYVSIDRKENVQGTLFSKPTEIVGDGKPEDGFVRGLTLPGKDLDLVKAANLMKSDSVRTVTEKLEGDESAKIETEYGVWVAKKHPEGLYDAEGIALRPEGIALRQESGGVFQEAIELIAYPLGPDLNRLELKLERSNPASDLRTEQLLVGVEGASPYTHSDQQIGPDLYLLAESVTDEMSLLNFGDRAGLPYTLKDNYSQARTATAISHGDL